MKKDTEDIFKAIQQRARELSSPNAVVRPDQLFGYAVYKMFLEALKRNNIEI